MFLFLGPKGAHAEGSTPSGVGSLHTLRRDRLNGFSARVMIGFAALRFSRPCQATFASAPLIEDRQGATAVPVQFSGKADQLLGLWRG